MLMVTRETPPDLLGENLRCIHNGSGAAVDCNPCCDRFNM
jgi:hypothetical protein